MNNQGKRGIVGKVAAWVRNLVKQPKPALAE
jgi:hypothetical protein